MMILPLPAASSARLPPACRMDDNVPPNVRATVAMICACDFSARILGVDIRGCYVVLVGERDWSCPIVIDPTDKPGMITILKDDNKDVPINTAHLNTASIGWIDRQLAERDYVAIKGILQSHLHRNTRLADASALLH